ncbi:MAG TPA: hypothetical protein VGI16_05450 [Candidatus Acidoferrum sp.]|jgi:hypothetical protein
MKRETIIEERLLAALRQRPESIKIYRSSIPRVSNVRQLVGVHDFEDIHDNSRWNPAKNFMRDVIGNMCPDIVLRSKLTGENRIYIEVKDIERLGYRHYDIEDSQVVRYFLHLLATTTKNPKDISRATLLCAPSRWFVDRHNAKAWGYFLEHFSGLATKFNITIGELHADEL